ncbi:uncharacterized protein LOC125494100 [Beta vulgaris subsp. vulgaris]|uniref:uncharacterized protein LOC125494100 n=1 Tax=Beta vulgaris subsp. vulgaris TaxID=3555 RepID=UPI002036CDCA|nr:uncharacterized protein LOC125494100 [Beta vulgaris subsp. vulgaris]
MHDEVGPEKAYDSVNWDFIQQMLEGVGFPRKFIELVMVCVRTPRFSTMLYGVPTGFFEAQRGIRQGDPMSHLLFALYDLLMFCHGDIKSIYMLLQGFQLFFHTSGLEVNKQKSEVYFTGMTQRDIQRVTEISGFKVGQLPFTYLGVPISTSKLKAKDCQALVEKMVIRIRVWGTRHLSFAARCQLVNSVLMSIHTYWGQLFIIPKSILKEVNSICRCFLWSGTHNDTKPGAVAWEKVCRNKKDGGLGFRDTAIWNMVALSKLAWGVAQKQDNLWVKWVHGVYIKESSWASYTAPTHASWAWKYVCQAKNLMNEKTNGVQWLMNGQFSIKQCAAMARNYMDTKETAPALQVDYE